LQLYRFREWDRGRPLDKSISMPSRLISILGRDEGIGVVLKQLKPILTMPFLVG
jgi:hypothetical protein